MVPEFVKTADLRFTLGGNVFPVRGVNCYFLGYCADESRRAVIQTACEMGANVVRAWAFLDRPAASPGSVAFQYAEGGKVVQDSGPDGLQRLDMLLAAAEEFDIRLVLPFVNYWSDFGGMAQYLSWLGVQGAQDAFYRDTGARAAYKNWVQALLTRRNSRTGRIYAEEPSVMAWELANEARCEIPGGRNLLLDWIGEMSSFVKSLDTNHLLATGDEGFLQHANTDDPLYDGSHGVDGEAILNFGEIDFGTYHFYPDTMGKPRSFGDTWIRDHVASGERANKPMLLAEYGVPANGDPEQDDNRKEWYSRWMQSVSVSGGGGELLWMLGSKNPDVVGFHDEFTVYSAIDVPALGVPAGEARSAGSTSMTD